MNKTNINLSVGFINRFWACCSSYMNIFNCTFVLSMLEHSLIAVHFNIGLQVWNIPENLPHLSHWHDFPCLQEGQVFLLPCLLGAWRLWLYFAVELPQKKHLRTCASHISVTAVIISAHCCAAPCVQQWQFYLPTFVCHSLSECSHVCVDTSSPAAALAPRLGLVNPGSSTQQSLCDKAEGWQLMMDEFRRGKKNTLCLYERMPCKAFEHEAVFLQSRQQMQRPWSGQALPHVSSKHALISAICRASWLEQGLILIGRDVTGWLRH